MSRPGDDASRSVRPRYDRVAWCYQEIAAAYSLGQVRAAKLSQLSELEAGSRVLYAGVGRGEDALQAARRGVVVTGLDCSAAMLKRFRRELHEQELEAEIVQADLFDHEPCDHGPRDHEAFDSEVGGPGYDAVAANFVLNVFPVQLMRRLLAHLGSLVRPGGRLLIADFALPSGPAWQRFCVRAYYRPVNLAAWALGLCALHPLYDYAAELRALGFEIVARREFRPFVCGPVLYESLVARRSG